MLLARRSGARFRRSLYGRRLIDEGAFECAVIHLNLHGESAIPLADRLVEHGKSFAIATGYGSMAVPRTTERSSADREAIRSASVHSIIGAAKLRWRLNRSLDHPEQPKNQD